MTNEEVIQKAKITADNLAAAGKLSPKQANRFIDYIVDSTILAKNARVARFRNEELEINKIGVGRRVAMPKALATAPTARRTITTGKLTLKPKEIIVPFEIGDNFVEINIEGDDVEDHIVRMMAVQLGNNLEELYILGDTLGYAVIEKDIYEDGDAAKYIKDDYLALTDGWLKLALGSNLFDAEGENVSSGLFSRMLMSMPEKFKRNKRNLRYFCSTEHEQLYRETMSTRIGASGEKALTTFSNLTPFGVELVPVPLLPMNPMYVQHVTLTGEDDINLAYADIIDTVVAASDLAQTPQDAYVEDTDYEVDEENGTIARIDGGSIGDGVTVKVTYKTLGKMILTTYDNFVVGIGRDIRIEKDRDIFAGTNMYAITCKVDVLIEEPDAAVLALNVGND